MEVIIIPLVFIGIFILQVLVSALYAWIEILVEKKPDNFADLWSQNLESMIFSTNPD